MGVFTHFTEVLKWCFNLELYRKSKNNLYNDIKAEVVGRWGILYLPVSH